MSLNIVFSEDVSESYFEITPNVNAFFDLSLLSDSTYIANCNYSGYSSMRASWSVSFGKYYINRDIIYFEDAIFGSKFHGILKSKPFEKYKKQIVLFYPFINDSVLLGSFEIYSHQSYIEDKRVIQGLSNSMISVLNKFDSLSQINIEYEFKPNSYYAKFVNFHKDIHLLLNKDGTYLYSLFGKTVSAGTWSKIRNTITLFDLIRNVEYKLVVIEDYKICAIKLPFFNYQMLEDRRLKTNEEIEEDSDSELEFQENRLNK